MFYLYPTYKLRPSESSSEGVWETKDEILVMTKNVLSKTRSWHEMSSRNFSHIFSGLTFAVRIVATWHSFRDRIGLLCDCCTNTVRLSEQVPGVNCQTATEINYLAIRSVVASRLRNPKFMREFSKYSPSCAQIIKGLQNTSLYLLKV